MKEFKKIIIIALIFGTINIFGQETKDQPKDKKGQGVSEGCCGIATGMGYFFGANLDTAAHSYIGSAYVDSDNLVKSNQNLNQISRVFPTFTGYWRPWHSDPGNKGTFSDAVFFGITLGVSTGATNQGPGFAMAACLSTGIIIGNSHFGLSLGVIADPTIQTLPKGYNEGGQAPTGITVGSSIKTTNLLGLYGAFGITFSIAL